MKESKSYRNSNVEFLRIVCMILIVAFHATRLGFADKTVPFFTYFSSVSIGSWGIMSVYVFVIISAWFTVGQRFKSRKVFSILLQTVSYILLYAVASVIVMAVYRHFNFSEIAKFLYSDFLDSIFEPLWAKHYWFISAYIIMIIISPFLNYVIDNLSRNKYKTLVIVLSFIPLLAQNQYDILSGALVFLYIYFVVGFIKKYSPIRLIRLFKIRWLILACVVVISSQTILYFDLPKVFSLFTVLIEHTFSFTGRNSIIMLAIAFMLFFIVKELPERKNSVINKVSSLTLGVYLFHEQKMITCSKTLDIVFIRFSKIGLISTTSLLFPVQYILISLFIFFIACVFELVRQIVIQKPICNYVYKRFSKLFDKIDNYMIVTK